MKANIFTQAHTLTKSIIAQGDDYRATFALVLKAIYGGTYNMKQDLILMVVDSVEFIYGKQKTHFKVTGADVYDLTNNVEFYVMGVYKREDSFILKFNNKKLYEEGRRNGVSIKLTDEQAELIKCLMTVFKRKDRELVEVRDSFIERKTRKKLNLGRGFKIGDKFYAYRYL